MAIRRSFKNFVLFACTILVFFLLTLFYYMKLITLPSSSSSLASSASSVNDDIAGAQSLSVVDSRHEKLLSLKIQENRRLEQQLRLAKHQLAELRNQIAAEKSGIRRRHSALNSSAGFSRNNLIGQRPPLIGARLEALKRDWSSGRVAPINVEEEVRGGEPPESDTVTRARRDKVREMMRFAFSSYRRYAWGQNELRPISKVGHSANIFGNSELGITILDSLDTLYIMRLDEEFRAASDWVKHKLDLNFNAKVSVFEFNIRFLAGLLTAYTFTNDKAFLSKAVALADDLLPAFDSPSGLPFALINLKSKQKENYGWASSGCSILAEFGSLHLEFAYLSELTGNPVYRQKVDVIRRILADASNSGGGGGGGGGLYMNFMNPYNKGWCGQHASLAGLGDSFYEYLLKEWVRTDGRDTQGLEMWERAMLAMQAHGMIRQSSGPSKFVYVGDYQGGSIQRRMDHLACFAGGMFALGSIASRTHSMRWLRLGINLTATCHHSYAVTPTHLGPESFEFDKSEAGAEARTDNPAWRKYLLRPETVESYFYLWRVTHHPKYREWAWQAVLALEAQCRVGAGYSGLLNVNFAGGGGRGGDEHTNRDDVQQSYFLAETLKYLYLIFSEDSLLPLNRWVFNTEAHPLPIKNRVVIDELVLPAAAAAARKMARRMAPIAQQLNAPAA